MKEQEEKPTNVLVESDPQSTLQNVTESLGGLAKLLSSDVSVKGDLTGRDRLVIQVLTTNLEAVDSSLDQLDRETS